MRIFIEKIKDKMLGECWEISTETWDGAIYFGETKEEAIARFEDDKAVTVDEVCEISY